MSSEVYYRSWMDKPHLDPNTNLLTEEYVQGIGEFMRLVQQQPDAKSGTQKLGIVRNAKLADVLVDHQWRFHNTRDSNIELSTRTRMRVWEITQGCPFCSEPDASRDHLFFVCLYIYGLWLQFTGSLLRLATSPDWTDILVRILSAAHDRLASILLKLALQVTVYYIWRERNERRHTQVDKRTNSQR
ncbi:hypothetical protein DY000_02022901 [Brassica cretica]|uniref:Reverse transcriptase zinc-binding domain-containing protein n=1 Tax=Brassica cretica TaxID=69181 RepID=A0ABQ7E905_BRACR|nr:hypothetical protein DY000_02022901 [Brassica cretica]